VILGGLRTKEALAAKKRQGVMLGKPKSTTQKSKFNKDLAKIKELLVYELSVRKIALNTYIKKGNIRNTIKIPTTLMESAND